MNGNRIQIENEFYAPIRPKSEQIDSKRPLFCLQKNGVDYFELRCLDLQPLSPLDMCGFERRFPNTLSGGQQARIALMRTLLSEPKALLLDEPFSKLDASLKDKIRKLVFSYAKENQLPTVLVTHDIKDAEASKGKIINLQDF